LASWKPDPVRDAKITVALISGESYSSIADRLDTSKQTISRIAAELKTKGIDTQAVTSEAKRQKFAESLEAYGVSTMNFMTNVAQLWSNPDYMRTQTPEDVIAVSNHLMGWVERLAKLGQPAPGPAALPATVHAEIVDE
jgi:hypothetical protein